MSHLYDPAHPTITPRIAAELIHHEGLVREAYRDSVGVWTWSVGITDASGHRVGRYRDQPQPLSRCLEVYLWALQNRYLPAVLDAFGAVRPEEHELAAALSFHWNTGAIGRAEWMRHLRESDRKRARRAMLDWCRPASLATRRKREQALFFEARWAGDGTAIVYEVAKPSYQPTRGKRHPMLDTLTLLLGGGPARDAEPTGAEFDQGPTKQCADNSDQSGENWFTRLFTC
ncbi:hypothetical protein EKN06_06340 [Croceicoccus ponticola]|uniref:Lysozyme n=1 Tax=Croceicoccus ponticola TaxID=2217664 RepID=A0A437GY38_9SPHN|nr:hypothetical protein [Croceicoccus ponticola]RVQ67566.1 hypothetical protein EKN06_06340 [Croceicoccus ponticola]